MKILDLVRALLEQYKLHGNIPVVIANPEYDTSKADDYMDVKPVIHHAGPRDISPLVAGKNKFLIL